MSALPALVSVDWLVRHQNDPDVRILDASFYLPNQNRDAHAEYRERHLPGAAFFDVEVIADPASDLPHMLPPPEQFGRQVGELGIDNADRVVVYDANRFLASARAWWMFRAMGHQDVMVLDGGLAAWQAAGQKLESGEVRLPARRFVARFRPELVLDLDRVRAVLEDGSTQVVDVRSPGRFRGAEPEPRAGLRSGHMPGAVNLPYGELIDTDGRLLPNDRLQMALEGAGIDLRLPVAASCGSGVSAAVLALAAYQLGKEDLAVYDGSWTEWGGRKDTPIVTE
ncbi:3-mercaptopyruvate sulfurtransferase [Geminicoccus harenae]|uniref:3-mercaptopyruvate sulfurtransferase n=3 Tax=Geminicoccus harenae TaxID=2498453 RepID=UPI001C940F46|nr:3-mercaptopyruvate sulfurtransferase [Geminicoccus harenae]